MVPWNGKRGIRMDNMFSQEFLRDINYRARFVRKLEVVRLNDPEKYFALAKQHNIKPGKFHTLPGRELMEMCERSEK